MKIIIEDIKLEELLDLMRPKNMVQLVPQQMDPPHLQLLRLIDHEIVDGQLWEGTSSELEELLCSKSLRTDTAQLFKNHNIGRMLGRLREEFPDRFVVRARPKGRRVWYIQGGREGK